MKKYKILLVDDDHLILKGVGKYLEQKGYQVTTADNGEKAIKLLEDSTFDLVITDLVMEHINGIQVLKASKRLNPDVMNIILTGHGDMESTIDALRLDADDYLLKPCANKELDYRIASCLEKLELKLKVKRAEENIRKAKNLESLGILSGGIAHDFNNLLYIIMGNISMAKDDLKPADGIAEFLNEAAEASLKAQELTKQLITFSKGGTPVKKLGSIGGLVKETTNFTLSGSNVKSVFFFTDDLWFVEFDDGQMQHAVKNIIDNAVESMPDGGSIDVKVENLSISSETTEQSLPLSEGKYVKITIRDHGVGIPEEHLSTIFDPYFSTKEKGIQKGMGLGLATTYSIISRHDGHITVESKVGVGTTLTIYLPAAAEEIVGIEPVKMAEPEKPAVCTGIILVMDDEEAIRRLSKQMLSRSGYESESAKDGAEAIELYKRAIDSGMPFDAVILDLTIKGGTGGKEVIKQLIKINPDIKAIVSSGYPNDPVMTNFRAYGFIGALPKPYPIKDLSDMLNQILGKS